MFFQWLEQGSFFVGLGSFWYGCNRKKKSVLGLVFYIFYFLSSRNEFHTIRFPPVCGVHASTTDDEFSSRSISPIEGPRFPFSTIDEPNAMNGSSQEPPIARSKDASQLVCGVCLDVGQRHGVHADVALVLPRQGNSFWCRDMDRKFLTRGSVKVALRRSSDTRNAKDGFGKCVS